MVTRRDMGVSFAPCEARRRVAASQARARPLAGCPLPPRTAHRRLAAAGLACLLEHLGYEALAPVLRGAGADAEIIVAAVGHGLRSCKLWRVRSCEARGHACISAGLAPQAARRQSRCVPRHPPRRLAFDGPTGAASFVLPSAFASRIRFSRQLRPGGWLHQQPAHRRTRRWPQASRVRGKTLARRTAAPRQREVQARMRSHCTRDDTATNRNDTPDGTMRCMRSESAAIMGGLQPDRARDADHGGCADRPKYRLSNDAGLVTEQEQLAITAEGGGTAARMAAARPSGRQAARRPKARRRCGLCRQRCTPLAARPRPRAEQRDARRQVAALRSERGNLGGSGTSTMLPTDNGRGSGAGAMVERIDAIPANRHAVGRL